MGRIGMAKNEKQPGVTAARLKAAFHDWRKKERRCNTIAYGKRQYSEPVLEAAAPSAEDAFESALSLLRRATGAKHHQSCAVVLPDGSHLVVVSERQLPTGGVRQARAYSTPQG